VSAQQIGVAHSSISHEATKHCAIRLCLKCSACASQGKVEMASNLFSALKDGWNGDSHRPALSRTSSSGLTAA